MSRFDYKTVSVRSAAILTGSYVAGTVIENVDDQNQLVLYVGFTKGSLTTAELKIEFSADNSNWYQEASESVSSGTATVSLKEHQFSATGNYRIPIALKDRYIRISVKGTGTVTSSSMAVTAGVGRS